MNLLAKALLALLLLFPIEAWGQATTTCPVGQFLKAFSYPGPTTCASPSAPLTQAKTTSYSVLPLDTYSTFSNQGAIGPVTFTLPPVLNNNGLSYCFNVLAAQTVTVQPQAADAIVAGSNVAPANSPLASSTVASSICLLANNNHQWIVNNFPLGVWTLNSLTVGLNYNPLNPSLNLSDLSNVATARANLGLGSIAIQSATAVAITGGTITGLTNLNVGGTTNFPGYWGTTSILATNNLGQNTIVGEVVNNLAPATVALPAGTAGACKMTSQGNACFGIYGLGELRQSGTNGGIGVGGELTVRNFTTNNPDINLPPNTAIGTTTTVPIDLNLTCGAGGGETKDCAIGLNIGNETGLSSDPIFNTAEYIRFYRQYALYIDAMPSGNQTNIVARNNGTGIFLQLQSTTALTGGNTVLTFADGGSVTRWYVTQNGALFLGQLAQAGFGGNLPTLNVEGQGTFYGYASDSVSGLSVSQTAIWLAQARGTQASKLAVATPDNIGMLTANGWDGTQYTAGTRIISTVSGTVSNGIVPAGLSLQTATTGGVLTPGLTIDNAQQVAIPGVVTGTPTASLCLNASNVIIKKTTTGSCV